MDMEADLGIDSIKKVEIFSSLGDDKSVDMMPQHADTEDAAEVLEALSTKKTIREIVDFFETLSSKSDKPSAEPTVSIKHEPTVAVTETEIPAAQPLQTIGLSLKISFYQSSVKKRAILKKC